MVIKRVPETGVTLRWDSKALDHVRAAPRRIFERYITGSGMPAGANSPMTHPMGLKWERKSGLCSRFSSLTTCSASESDCRIWACVCRLTFDSTASDVRLGPHHGVHA